jgi:2'-5' RNA ligase
MHGQRLDNAVERVEGVVARVLRGIARTIAALVGASPSVAALSDDDLQPIRREWEQAVASDIVPAVADAYAESARTVAEGFADAGRPVAPLSLDAPATADFLDAATNRLVGVSDTLWEIARKELADGIRAGEGVEELAARLQEAGGFGISRARMIARTEVVAASNAASLAQALRLGEPSMSKVWLDSDDDRVRPAHEAVDGQTVPLGEPFEVGGEFLMYPGQPIGSASNVINERCGIGYSWDEPLTAAGPDEFHLPGKHDQSEHGEDGPNAPDSTGGRTAAGNTNAGGRAGRDPTSVGETVKRYGPKSLTLAAHDDGQLSLTDDNGNTVRLTAADVDSLRASALDSYDMQVGDEFTVRHTEDRGGTPYTTLRMLVQKTAAIPEEEAEEGEESYLRDTLAVHLAPNDDPDFDELRNAPPVEMTARELADLAAALTDLETAGRVDTGHGQVDMFTDGRSWVLRPVDGPELRLNRRGFRTLDRALDAVVDDFEGENDPGPGGLPGEADTAERTVDTNIGTVTVSLKGGLGVGDLTIRVHDPDTEIVVAPAQQSAFLRQFGSLSEVLTASAARRKGVAMPAVVPMEAVVTAAAEVHTGAMVALRPSLEDAKRLAVDGGEPADQLHTTLMYLGAAADIPEEAQARIIEAMWQLAEGMPPLTVEGFAVSAFNPGDSNDRDPCIVLGLSGDGLDDIHGQVGEALSNLESEPAGFTLPEQHAPWQPHVTLVYTDDVSMVERLADRVGPVTFDAIRVAFAGEVFDIPLGQPETEGDGDGEPDGDFDWSSYFEAAIQAQFQSRMPPQLQAHWIRRLRLGTKGSFEKCVRELREYFPEDTEGLCANLYKTATGRWPSQKKDNAAGADEVAFADTLGEQVPVGAPDTDALAAQPGEHFHTWVMEGVSTGLRQFAPGAITWREPPFAFHWQWKSSAHNGLPETVQTGLVTRVVRDGDTVHFFGKLDLRSPEGLDYARRLAEGWARWSSVGADESVKEANIDVEYVLADGEIPVDDDAEIDLMTFRDYRVAEVTGVSVPALADALVEATPELIDTLTQMGVLEPAATTEDPQAEPASDTFDAAGETMPEMTMPADVETPDVTVNLNDDGTVTLAWADTDLLLTAADAALLADTLESAPPGTHQVGALTVDRAESGDVVLATETAEVALSPADAEILAAALRSFPAEEVDDEEVVVAAARSVVRSVTITPTRSGVTEVSGVEVMVAAGQTETHTITIPNVPPADWFTEPPADLPQGAFTITDEGRVYGYLAPAGIAHRAFRNRRVEVPMGNVDYSRWMGSEAIVAGGGRVVAGPITFECGHCDPRASTDPTKRMEHYDNSCSIAAKAAIGENEHGVWIAGALEPGVSAEQVSRMLGCRLSGDWAPHPEKAGWREFVAALLVPVPGFPMARSAPSTLRVADGALVAAAVPVRLEVTEAEDVDPGPSDKPAPDLQPAMDFMARAVGRDPASRMAALRDRIHRTN